ncbi:outer membrane protein assembly factor BamB family protein [Mycolicibacterium mageritense]|uniref:outer membrane protein assembly factor BamB family protein n=1 Tax=Mycolicibacterium mageritense TaxID=53462 RepID=UPI001E50D904|nr:PQQ-binding-like beta-propeller repeat protein [Mycolicibacterium mageritense]
MVNQWGPADQGSPFGTPEVRPEPPPVFGASPFGASPFGVPPQPAWGQQPVPGYPPPPPPPRRTGKTIGIVVAAIVAVIALAIGGVVVWQFRSGGSSDTDMTAGLAEVASGEVRPPADVEPPSLSAAPTTARWTYSPGSDSPYMQVLGGDSKTVIVMVKDSIVGLDAASGSQVWQQPWPESNGAYPYCVVGTSGETAVCDGGSKTAVILDMKTGSTKSTVSDQESAYAYGGAGLLAVVDNTHGITVLDDSGQQLWKKSMTGTVVPFLDQGIVAAQAPTGTQFYDAKTGDDVFSIGFVDDLIATSRGIAVAVRGSSIDVEPGRFPKQRIDFYSFTGKKAWSIPEDQHYRLPKTSSTGRFDLARSVRNGTSGVALPVVYSEDRGEIAGVDDATGEILWSQQVPLVPHTLPGLAGIGELCLVGIPTDEQGHGKIRARKCTDGTGALIAAPEETSNYNLVVADGDQTVIGGGEPATAYDALTGQQSWQWGEPDIGATVTWVGDGLYGYARGTVSRLA